MPIYFRPPQPERFIEFADGSMGFLLDGPKPITTRSGLEMSQFRFIPIKTMRYKYQIGQAEMDDIDGAVTKDYPIPCCVQQDKDSYTTKWLVLCNYNYKAPLGELFGFGDPLICDKCTQPIIDKIKEVCEKCLQPKDDMHEVRTYDLEDGRRVRVRINKNKAPSQFLVNKDLYIKYTQATKEVATLRRENATLNVKIKQSSKKGTALMRQSVEEYAELMDVVNPPTDPGDGQQDPQPR